MDSPTPSPRPSLASLLGLNRTVAVVLVSVLFFGLGEQLWEPFMPAFLDAQTKKRAQEVSSIDVVPWLLLLTVGMYSALRNLFEGFCYVGGGRLTNRLGDRGSLLLFGVLSVAGYLLFLVSPGVAWTVAAALLIVAWEPLSVPVTFTTVGSTVQESRRGMAFALQSIQKRLPKILGPLLAGFVLGAAERSTVDPIEGRIFGMRALIGISLGLAVISLVLQFRYMPPRKAERSTASDREVFARFPPTLRRLLLAEVFTRWCDHLVREFVLLYLFLVRGVPLVKIGQLIALQHLVALLTYLPVGKMTERTGLRPFVGLTFVFFALFPVTLALVPDELLVVAFVVYGLREIGEPARKALITSSLPEAVRARGVGLYWGLRSFAIFPASLAGAAVWWVAGPRVLLLTAGASGAVGAAVFYLFCRRATESAPGASIMTL